MRRAAVSALMALALTCSAYASNEALQKDLFMAFQIGGEGPMGIADRRHFAEAALAYWKDFDSRIPRNSPTEDEWLKSELDTTDMGRITRVLNSPQYALRTLSQRSSDCVYLFDYLLPQIGDDPAFELYLWLKTTSCWREAADLATYLRIAGLSNGKLDDTFKMQGFTMALEATYGRVADGAIMAEQLP